MQESPWGTVCLCVRCGLSYMFRLVTSVEGAGLIDGAASIPHGMCAGTIFALSGCPCSATLVAWASSAGKGQGAGAGLLRTDFVQEAHCSVCGLLTAPTFSHQAGGACSALRTGQSAVISARWC